MSKNKLTRREKEIVKEVAKDKTNKQIASDLGMKDKTLESHMKSIHAKLLTHDKVGITLWVIDNPDQL